MMESKHQTEWNTFNQSIPACIYIFLTVQDYIFMVPRALFNSHIFLFSTYLTIPPGFPSGSMVKNLPANAGDRVLIPGSGQPPGGGNGNLLQYGKSYFLPGKSHGQRRLMG